MREPGQARWLGVIFIGAALVMVAAVVLYPLVWSGIRSLYDDGPAGTTGSFIGLRNYGHVFTDHSTFRAVKHNLIWVIVPPTIITILGLICAVLPERFRWAP